MLDKSMLVVVDFILTFILRVVSPLPWYCIEPFVIKRESHTLVPDSLLWKSRFFITEVQKL